MSHFLLTAVAMAIVLGVMILVHEWGHYAAAKFFKVKVEVFSIGFGKRLLGFRRGETDYRISAIPLGGYVKMSGENPMDERTDDPGEFLNHPRWQRFIIAIAGPFMNVVLAVGLLTIVYMVHYEYPAFIDQPGVIAYVRTDSAAAQAGLQAGDRILRIAGIENPTWEQIGLKIMLSPNEPLPLIIGRNGQVLQTTIKPKPVSVSEIGSAGWSPAQSIMVADVEAGMPAAKAGIREGDEIVAVDGKPVPVIEALIDTLQQTKDRVVTVEVLRGSQKLSFQLQPVLADAEGKEKRYRVGFESTPRMKVGTLALIPAFQRSLEDNKRYSLVLLELIQKMVKGKVSMRQVEGPIGIGSAIGHAVTEKGWMPLLGLTAGISLNLGIFNLLPIPILDGGVIMLLLIESLMRRDISLQIKERIYQAAFVFLVLFAVTVIYNDIVKRLPLGS
ncbi:MAG TPA: RIP metalloprotease RseP [Terriglobales bacterium]|nr:RIP metalloprotease RseP [Terriglobales bacterium]